jgi:hypothetical protein
MSATRYWSCGSLLALVALLGPGPRALAGDKLAVVKGNITLDGKPLPGGRIIFHQDNGQFVGAKIDKDGKFKVDRVPVGTRKVTLEFKGARDEYASEEKSLLQVEVKSGTNSFNFDLKSKGRLEKGR